MCMFYTIPLEVRTFGCRRARARSDGWVDSFVTRETTRRYRVVLVVFVSFSLCHLVVLQRGGASRRAV